MPTMGAPALAAMQSWWLWLYPGCRWLTLLWLGKCRSPWSQGELRDTQELPAQLSCEDFVSLAVSSLALLLGSGGSHCQSCPTDLPEQLACCSVVRGLLSTQAPHGFCGNFCPQ